MRLSVPANWDFSLLDKLTQYPVEEVYGMLNYSIVGGGRPSIALPVISKRRIAGYVKKAHSLGMKFNYTLNTPCLNNLEFSGKFRNDLFRHLSWINDIGADSVTVSIPYLIELIKKKFPKIKVKVSAIAYVNSVQKTKLFEELGADEITLFVMINRNFDLLENIRKAAGCNLRILVNDMCLYQCPFMQYHYNVNGHASQNTNSLKGFYIDYCLIKCTIIRFSRPQEILKSRWVRPEDLNKYEQIGIDSFKIAGRTKHSEWILNTVKAYSSRRYDGNFVDLIDCVESSMPKAEKVESGFPARQILHFSKRYFSVKKYNMFLQFLLRLPINLYSDLLALYFYANKVSEYIYIENNKLDGFIDFFKDTDCDNACSNCNHCKEWAERSIIVDSEKLKAYTDLLNKILNKCF